MVDQGARTLKIILTMEGIKRIRWGLKLGSTRSREDFHSTEQYMEYARLIYAETMKHLPPDLEMLEADNEGEGKDGHRR